MLTVKEISERLSDHAETICRELLPNGKLNGNEWEVGNIHGEEGKSLKVCVSGLKKGIWSDFASNDGGDLIDLYCAINGSTISESVKWAKGLLGIKNDSPVFQKAEKRFSKPLSPKCAPVKTKSKVVQYFEGRGISEKTLKRYRISEQGDMAYYPSFIDGELVMWKAKSIVDKKKSFTSKDTKPCLFGWQAIPDRCREVVLTEGEEDALSYGEFNIPAVSLPYGGGAGEKQRWIDYEYDHLLNFDIIYVSTDNDEVGKEALQEIMNRLGQHRVMVPELFGYKDANEALKAGVDLRNCIKQAYSIDPDELRPASDFHDEVMEYLNQGEQAKGDYLPWAKTHQEIRIRGGEASIWLGINGHGKTQMLGQVCVNNAFCHVRTCVASLEMKPNKLLSRMYRQAAFSNVLTDEQGLDVKKLLNEELWLFNVRGTSKGERILEVFKYACRKYNIKQFVVDNLSKCGFNEDDYNGQKDFVDRLTDFAVEHDVHVHLVVHSRKGSDENSPPNKMDVKGSGAITDMADNVFSVWRNKPKEADVQENGRLAELFSQPDALLCCWKQRNGEWEGSVKLWFDPRSLQFTETDTRIGYKYI